MLLWDTDAAHASSSVGTDHASPSLTTSYPIRTGVSLLVLHTPSAQPLRRVVFVFCLSFCSVVDTNWGGDITCCITSTDICLFGFACLIFTVAKTIVRGLFRAGTTLMAVAAWRGRRARRYGQHFVRALAGFLCLSDGQVLCVCTKKMPYRQGRSQGSNTISYGARVAAPALKEFEGNHAVLGLLCL